METVGDRAFLIRQARGTPRKPETLQQLAAALNGAAEAFGLAVRYTQDTVARMETGRREIGLDDVKVLAAVDPLQRGRLWLAYGEEGATAGSGTGDAAHPPPLPLSPRPSGVGHGLRRGAHGK